MGASAAAAAAGAAIGGITNVAGELGAQIIQGEYNAEQARLQRQHEHNENIYAREFNKQEAAIDRNFQQRMRDTSFVSAVNQAKQLGISPSLLLGDQSNQLGGSRASASSMSSSGKASISGVNNPLSPISDIINKMLDKQHQRELAEDRQAHARELAEDRQKYQEERDKRYFEHQKELAKIYSTNSTTSKEANKRNYTKKELDNLYTDINSVEI